MTPIQKKVDTCFKKNFGRTPLRQRIDDILKEAIELSRFSDLRNLKEETGDLMSSLLQLCNENEWQAEDLIEETIRKIQKRALQYKSLGRKLQVAILGGAFNPPTMGHIKLAQFVLDSSKTFDEVWLTPCYSHMYNKEMVATKHRLAMCKLAAENDGRIKIFDYEISNKLQGATYNMVKRLLDEDFAKHEVDFSLIIGLDNANTFDQWVDYELLEKMIRFVVVPRKGVKRDERVNWYLKQPHIYLSPDNEIPEISSTDVRLHMADYWYRLNKGEGQDFVMTACGKKVFDYMARNRLYQIGPQDAIDNFLEGKNAKVAVEGDAEVEQL